MQIKINFSLYENYFKQENEDRVFKIENPKIELDVENFKKMIYKYIDKNIIGEKIKFVKFMNYNNIDFCFDIFFPHYEEENKQELNKNIENLILGIINEFRKELNIGGKITDMIEVYIHIGFDMFYNLYSYRCGKSENGEFKHWLEYFSSVGKSDEKLTTYKKFIKKGIKNENKI